MPGRSSKFTAAQNAQLEFDVLDVLINAERALTIEEIQNSSVALQGFSSQKLSRVLNGLVERGTASKGKSKEKNRMIYMVN